MGVLLGWIPYLREIWGVTSPMIKGGFRTESDSRRAPTGLQYHRLALYSVVSSDVHWKVTVWLSVSRRGPDWEHLEW